MLAQGVTGTQSKKVYRGGRGSLLTPTVWPKRAKPPAWVDGPLGEDREGSGGQTTALLSPHGFLLLLGAVQFCISPILNYDLDFEKNCKQWGECTGSHAAKLSRF